MVPGMMPLTPPPSILRIVISFPDEAGGFPVVELIILLAISQELKIKSLELFIRRRRRRMYVAINLYGYL